MPITPHDGIDPSWYDKSILSKNVATDLPTLIQRLRRFDRDSVALMAAACSWYVWINDAEGTDLDKILRTHAMFVATIGLAFCSPKGRPIIDEASFRIVVGELFNLSPYSPRDPIFIQGELEPLVSALTDAAKAVPLLLEIDATKDIHDLFVNLIISRTALMQWNGFSFRMGDFVRTFLIYKKFRELVINRSYCTDAELDAAERIFLGTSLERFFRAIWLIFTFSTSTVTKQNPLPSPFEPRANYLSQDSEILFDLKDSDLEVVANRLSIDASKFRNLLGSPKHLPATNWLHAKQLWVLYDYPLVRFDDNESRTAYLNISPWRYLRRSITYISQDLINYFEENNTFGPKNRAYLARGDAYEEYLFNVIKRPEIKKPDDLLPSNYTGKKCDFIWEGKDFMIAIEAKVKIRPNNDPTFFTSKSMISSWATAIEAIEQTKATISATNTKKKWALIIATDEQLAEQATQFTRVAKRWNFIEGTEIDAVAICPTSQIEYITGSKSADEVYEALVDTWNRLDPKDIQSEIHNYAFFSPEDSDDNLEHIQKAWEEIIPGFKSFKKKKLTTEK